MPNAPNEPVLSTDDPKAIDLSSLREGMAGLTSACGTSLAESAAVCLEDRSHTPGVFLSVNVRIPAKANSIPEGSRTPFRAQAEQHSGMVPNTSRSVATPSF